MDILCRATATSGGGAALAPGYFLVPLQGKPHWRFLTKNGKKWSVGYCEMAPVERLLISPSRQRIHFVIGTLIGRKSH